MLWRVVYVAQAFLYIDGEPKPAFKASRRIANYLSWPHINRGDRDRWLFGNHIGQLLNAIICSNPEEDFARYKLSAFSDELSRQS